MIVGIIAKRTIATQQKKFIDRLIRRIRQDGSVVMVDENIAPGKTRDEVLRSVDLAIVLGGDGTMLKVAGSIGSRKVHVVGVNFGNVGFLTSIHPSEIDDAWKKIKTHEYEVQKRMLLDVELYRQRKRIKTFTAMNEAVINQGSFARLIELTMNVENQKMISFKADGMIIATPTGSTAHSLSAGGPVVHHELSAFIVTPICPASLTFRPIVIPSTNSLTVTIATERRKDQNIGLTIDGQVTVPLEYGDEVKIRKSKRSMYLVNFEGSGYYKLLREKLGWGIK